MAVTEAKHPEQQWFHKIYAKGKLGDLPAYIRRYLHVTGQRYFQIDRLDAVFHPSEITRLSVLTRRLAATGHFGLRPETVSFADAVTQLTLPGARHLIFSCAICDLLRRDEVDTLSHLLSSSLAMRRLLQELELSNLINLPLAMLFHDLGKILIRRGGGPDETALHADAVHARIGAMLLEHWNLSPEIVAIVAGHHLDQLPERYVAETALAQLANYIDGTARRRIMEPPRLGLLKRAGLERIDIDRWVNRHQPVVVSVDAAIA